jgi:cytochrome P450
VRYDLSDAGLLFRPDVLADPTGLYAQLREEAPVWEIPRSSTFLVTRADFVSEAVARPEDFSSNLTSLVYRDADGGTAVFDMRPLGHAIHVLATADPPVHTRHRRLLQPLLTPGSVARFERWTTAAADELQGDLLASGAGDYVAQVADLLPMRVLSMLVGFPADDVPRLVKLVLDVDQILAGVSDADAMARAAASAAEQAEYLAVVLDRAVTDGEAAAVPGVPPTMSAHLARAVTDGEVAFDEAVGMLVQILGAGTETTTSLIGTAAKVLAQDPALQQRLRAQPELVPTFLEEVLRLDGPFRFHYRSVPRDTHLAGVAIPAGSRLLLMWGAANLDGDAYPQPDRLDLDRPVPKSHLAFGRGIHFCIGAPLARLEARVAITRLLGATASLTLDDDLPPRLHPDIFLRRLSQLGLRVVTTSVRTGD